MTLPNVPEGWSLTPVGDLLTFKNGLNKAKAFFGYGTPIVNYMDVFDHAGLLREDIAGLVDVTNAEKQAYSARKGDVFFTRTSETTAEIGISAVLIEDVGDAVFSGFVLRGRPQTDRLTSNFAKYCFGSQVVRDQIVSSATYTTRALTNGRTLSSVLLPLPDDPDEQEAIAEALSDADVGRTNPVEFYCTSPSHGGDRQDARSFSRFQRDAVGWVAFLTGVLRAIVNGYKQNTLISCCYRIGRAEEPLTFVSLP